MLEAFSPLESRVPTHCLTALGLLTWVCFLVFFFSVLEACGACGQDLGTEELWQKVLQEVTVEELQAPLHRLGALQAAWWLAASQLGSVAGLFQLLSTAEVTGHRQSWHKYCVCHNKLTLQNVVVALGQLNPSELPSQHD